MVFKCKQFILELTPGGNGGRKTGEGRMKGLGLPSTTLKNTYLNLCNWSSHSDRPQEVSGVTNVLVISYCKHFPHFPKQNHVLSSALWKRLTFPRQQQTDVDLNGTSVRI